MLRRHCEEVGRDPDEVAVTVLDLPVVGRDRDDVWERVERLRGRTGRGDVRPPAPRGHARPSTGSATRRSPSTACRPCSCALPDLARPEDLLAVAAMLP